MQTLLGNGDGSLQPPVTVATDTQGLFPAVGDLNGDGNSDLAITDAFLPAVNVHLGSGDGTFESPLGLGASTYPFSVSVVDLNADRLPEIITANGFDSSVAVLLNTTGADFSISASALTPGSVKRGQSATSTLTFAHLNALGDAVTLSCSVQPVQSAPTCSLSPRSVTSDPNGQATATLTINTSTASALNSFSVSPDSRALHFVLWLPVVCFALVGTSLVSRKSAEKGLAGLLIGGLIVGVLIFQVACGGVNNSGPHSTTYHITVTGKSGSTQRSTTVTLAVQ